MYMRWRRSLPDWIRVRPVELPGRGARIGQGFQRDFKALVAQLSEELAQEMASPCALFGHSMGGLLVHALAVRQLALGRPLPQAVFVSACAAPQRRDPLRFAGGRDDASLIAELRRQGGTPEEVFAHDELLRMTLDTLAADYDVCHSYRPTHGPRLPLPLHVLQGRQDALEAERLEAWEMEAGGRFSLDVFEGGHFFLRESERETLAALVHHLEADQLRQGQPG